MMSTDNPPRRPMAILRYAAQFLRARCSAAQHLLWRITNRDSDGGRWIAVYGHGRLYVSVDDYRAFRIARLGGSQKEKVAIIEALCTYRPAVMIDVGANYGEFSVIPVGYGIDCILLEPNPLVVRCLAKTMGGFPNATVIPSAAGNTLGEVDFYFCSNASGSGSVSVSIPQFEAGLRGGDVRRVTIPLTTIDSILSSRFRTPPRSIVMKIDVEGFEREVLCGARASLGAVSWWRALVEFSPDAIRRAGKSIEHEWAFFRTFEGFVLDGIAEPSFPTMLRGLSQLAGPAPERDVDIVLGAGMINDGN